MSIFSNLSFPSPLIFVKRSSFLKNLLIVMSGTAIAQATGFALSPIISRLFSPADFGLFGSFSAVLAIITAGITLEYSQAILLPKDVHDACNLLVISIVSVFFIGFLCFILCLFFPTVVYEVTHISGAIFLLIFVLAAIITGLNQTFQAWCVRVKAFKHTSASQVIRSLSSNGIQIGTGFVNAGALGLILGNVLAELLATLNLAFVFLNDFKSLRPFIKLTRLKQLLCDYRDFPLYSASANVLNALSQGLPVLLLTHFYGISVAGYYAFAMRILQAPIGFVSRSLRQVLFQKACETHNQGGRLFPLFLRFSLGLLAAAFLPALLLIVFAPQIFTVIFGRQWDIAGEFARWLVLWLLCMFCNLPSVLFARIIRIQRQVFVFEVILLTARTGSLLFGGMFFTAFYTVLLFSIVGVIMNITFIVIVGRALYAMELSKNIIIPESQPQ